MQAIAIPFPIVDDQCWSDALAVLEQIKRLRNIRLTFGPETPCELGFLISQSSLRHLRLDRLPSASLATIMDIRNLRSLSLHGMSLTSETSPQLSMILFHQRATLEVLSLKVDEDYLLVNDLIQEVARVEQEDLVWPALHSLEL